MGMLDRYKKGNGINDLIKLVEDSGEPKRSQLLNMVRAEDPDFAAKVEARVLNWEKVKALPEGLFAEVIGSSAPKFIALAIFNETPEIVTLVEKCLGKLYNDYKQEKENLKGTTPTPAQIEAARRKIMGEARKLEAAGKVKFGGDAANVSPSAETPANTNTSLQKQAPVSDVINGNPPAGAQSGGGASEGSCPSVDSFKLEQPPPGLSGERLETYLKSMLG